MADLSEIESQLMQITIDDIAGTQDCLRQLIEFCWKQRAKLKVVESENLELKARLDKLESLVVGDGK